MNSPLRELALQICYLEHSVVEKGCGERRVCIRLFEHINEIVDVASAARRDYRYFDGLAHGPRQRQIVTFARTVGIHARQENFAGAARGGFVRPLDRVAVGRRASAVDDDFPRFVFSTGIDGNDDTLAAEFRCGRVDECRTAHGRTVDGDLVATRPQEISRVVDSVDSAADGERYRKLRRNRSDDGTRRAPSFDRGGDVEKDEFVRAGIFVRASELGRISRVDQINEADAFYDASALDIQTRDNAPSNHDENMEATPRVELGNGAFAELCLTTWLRRHATVGGAGTENRTRTFSLGS